MLRAACLAALVLGSASLIAGSASAQISAPVAGSNTLGPEYIITYNANGTFTTGLNTNYSTDPGAYDGSGAGTGDDTYFGVINHNAGVLSSIFLNGGPGSNIMGFEGDGIVAYGVAGNAKDSTGYGGPNAFFNVVNADSGTVVFGANGIAPGSTDIFSLEEAVAINTLVVSQGSVPEPSTWAMMILGFAGIGFLSYRRARKNLAIAAI